jgi:hypothetical protein
MFRLVVLGVGCLLLNVPIAVAQQSSAPAAPPPDEESMEEPLVGDHWTYETRDDITGDIKSTATQVVTEVSAAAIGVRVNVVGNPNAGYISYDRSWNAVITGVWKNSPSDGTGVRLPLAAGNTWKIQSSYVNTSNGASFKRSGTSKVVGRESVTTQAGTFDAFKIETSYVDRNSNNPTRKAEATMETWYVPSIDHWVKRTITVRSDGRVRENNSVELVEFGRR